jgi:hypothetical protein
MNERIRELAEQAQQYAEYVTPQGLECFDTFKEKFADLIVEECVRYFNEDYVRDFDVLWRDDLSKGIKEHFGVE